LVRFGIKPVGQNCEPRPGFEFGLNSEKFEFNLELEFKFTQNLEYIQRNLNSNLSLNLNLNLSLNLTTMLIGPDRWVQLPC
jgi:hypothetical protein